MENRAFSTSNDLQDKLISSLISFVQLHGQHGDRVRTTSESFMMLAQLHQTYDDTDAPEGETDHSLFTVFAGVLGAACGGVFGGALGALGGVGAATYKHFNDDISAVEATVGFVGGVLGGAVGGVFSGAIGSAVCATAEAKGSPLPAAVSNFVWFTIGFAAGGAVGCIFGGKVGAAGGGVGGGFGAMYTTKRAVTLVGSIVRCFSEPKESKGQKPKLKVELTQKPGEFMAAIKPLVQELKRIKLISDKMASSDIIDGVAVQTGKTLAAVNAMQESLGDCGTARHLPPFVEEAAKQSQRIREELETTCEQANGVLALLKKQRAAAHETR